MKTRWNLNGMKLILMISMACVLPLAMTGCGDTNADIGTVPDLPRPVKAVRLESLSGVPVLSLPGTTKAVREVKLAFRVGGPLVKLEGDTGDRVEKGQVIARIDSRDFEVRIKTLEAGLAASRSRLTESKLQYDRYVNLIRENAAAKATYDQVRAAFEMAKAGVKADEKNLEAARNALKDTLLKAPFVGYIQEKFVENHETVALGQPILSLVDLSSVEVVVGIPENRVSQVDQFEQYLCRLESIPGKSFEAVFKEIAKKPAPSNQTYPLTLVLAEGNSASIRPGMSAEVSISFSNRSGTPTFGLPPQAIVNDNQRRTFVWVVDEKTRTVGKRYVTSTGFTPEGIEVAGDLAEGEWVVTAGASFLKEGQLTRILEPVSKTNVGNEL